MRENGTSTEKAQEKAAERPITTAEYFDLVCGILREKGCMPDEILDYALASYNPVPMKTYEFNIRSNLNYGDSEGIYLDLAIEFYEDKKRCQKELGTFKTLREDQEAMRTMARLLADFIVEERAYVNRHLDDFTWTGMDVYGLKEDGTKAAWGYSCADRENAMKRKDELLKKYARVSVRDNATREVKIYGKGAENDSNK